jgi:hypothetical protein
MRLINAVIMVGGGGNTPQERLMVAAQQAAVLDLTELLKQHGVDQIIIAAPTTGWIPPDLAVLADSDPPDRPFHFGERLATLLERYPARSTLYFGGGSAPLIDQASMGMIVGLLERSGTAGGSVPTHIALTNNLHSSDWVALSHTREAIPIARACERDNSLAWLLKESGEFEVRVLSGVRPATSFDLDTPSDLALIAEHRGVGVHLRGVIERHDLSKVPVARLLEVCRTEATTVGMIGRVSPLAWGAFNKSARCWTRVLAEERGMVAAQRVEHGLVRSMLVPLIKSVGVARFFDELVGMCDAVLFDNRVLWAALGVFPTAADRFASDLYWIDTIQDQWIREFTTAAFHAPIPIVMGGHSVVAGGVYVLTELL